MTDSPLTPLQLERMRERLVQTEEMRIRNHGTEPDIWMLFDAYISTPPFTVDMVLNRAGLLEAKKHRHWWLPWRKGGGRG